jgi:hypothetical protein
VHVVTLGWGAADDVAGKCLVIEGNGRLVAFLEIVV